MTEVDYVKKCKIHGNLTLDQTRKDGKQLRCKQCRIETNKASYEVNREKRVAYSIKWKKENRSHYNEWLREDRKNNPDKYRKYEQNYIEKHGIEHVRKQEVVRIRGLTIEEYDQLFIDHKNKCKICGKEETRRSKKTKESMPLCVDHCHKCKDDGYHGLLNVRGLLCHECNKGLGAFDDNPLLLKIAIKYLNSHKHIEE